MLEDQARRAVCRWGLSLHDGADETSADISFSMDQAGHPGMGKVLSYYQNYETPCNLFLLWNTGVSIPNLGS
jgi:hypothetical protein